MRLINTSYYTRQQNSVLNLNTVAGTRGFLAFVITEVAHCISIIWCPGTSNAALGHLRTVMNRCLLFSIYTIFQMIPLNEFAKLNQGKLKEDHCRIWSSLVQSLRAFWLNLGQGFSILARLHTRLDNSLLWGAVLCTVECLATSMIFTHKIPVATS